ncbi:hypothetical protein ACLOJK_027224 [Asimina triloba]
MRVSGKPSQWLLPYLMTGLRQDLTQATTTRDLHHQQKKASSSSSVCGKDIVLTASDLVFFFSTMAPKKVGHPTPSEEVEAGYLTQPQCEKRSPPHNAIAARPLHVADAPPPEDWPQQLIDASEISCLTRDYEIPPAIDGPCPAWYIICPPSYLSWRPLTVGRLSTDPGHGPECTSSPSHFSASSFVYIEGVEREQPTSLPLIMQSIPNEFQISEMVIFGPASDTTGHVVDYNIHMDLHTTSEGLKCKAFPTTLDKQEKMWFTSLAPGSITSFRQLIDLFEAWFSNQQ